VSLLKDGTFTGFVLIPAVLGLLLILASGSLVVIYWMSMTEKSLILAFTPSFIQTVTGVALAFPFFVVLCIVLGLALYRNRPILQANPTVNQYLGSDGKVMKEEIIEGRYSEVPASRQITSLSQD
jgi:hypothetical protein